MNSTRVLILSLLTICLIGLGCSKKKAAAQAPAAPPPESYCPYLPSQTFASAVTITGSAGYEYRANGNGAVAAPAAIRYAEVMVKDASGTIVQCAETDASGNFSFQLPSGSGSYTVQVNSRANNDNVKAYVMDTPSTNLYYSVSTTVGSSADSSITLTAPATESLEGGAFNILDKIVAANVYLRANTDATDCGSYTDCISFTVAPVVYVYWKKGFNPATYLDPSWANSGASFYLKGTNELYILGGIANDVDSSDCDHFDDTIILHEYGHFIENYYAVSDSPGGSHAPDDVLDPRLAWSEAFANFFQAAVTGTPVYRDTEGNVSCGSNSCTGVFHNEPLETATNYDANVAAGEGNFHEFSITRFLWDIIDPHPVSGQGGTDGGSDTITAPFAEIWTVFAGASAGFKSTVNPFRSVSLFHTLQQNLGGTYNLSSLRTLENQTGTRADWATPVTAGTCADISIQAKQQTDGSFSQSDLFHDNDFYAYYHSGGTLTVRVVYTKGVTNQSDVDLIVWKDGFTYGDTADALATSLNASDGGDEEISVSAPAGWYMINVMVNPVATTSGGGTANLYKLYINGQQNCPNP
jgi:hypothetical protein